RAQLALLEDAIDLLPEPTARPATPIPPEMLRDDDDEPTLFLTAAQPRDSSDELMPVGAATVADGAAPAAAQQEALELFAVEDLNRWLSSGTPFQLRKELAYLNLSACSRMNFDFQEKLAEMGFPRRLGLLEAEDLEGRVLLFRR
ncbi:MAG: hypothetical protein ACYTFT_09625, partial [Planctomycetota bacterium]